MIAAYSPQAGPLRAQLRNLARAFATRASTGKGHHGGEANRFLREHYIARFNARFSVAAAEKGTAFRRTSRTDLNCIHPLWTACRQSIHRSG